MASAITAAGKKSILDKGIGGVDWYAILHDSATAVPANGNKLAADPIRLQDADWTIGSESNPTARPSADLSFTAKAGDVGDRPQRVGFWSASDISTGSPVLYAWADIFEAGSTTKRLAAIAEADQGVILDHDTIVLTLS